MIILFSGYAPLFNDHFYEAAKKLDEERMRKLKNAYNPFYNDFLFINEVDDTYFNFNAKSKCYILAEVNGTDFTNFTLDDEVYEVSYGLNIFSIDFGDEFTSHAIEIKEKDVSNKVFKWLCVEPLCITQDNITVNLVQEETISFYAGGPISILIHPDFSYNWLYLEVDGKIINDIYDTSEYPEINNEFYHYLTESGTYIRFDLNVKPKEHTIKIMGNGTIEYKILVNFDWDEDIIYDVEELFNNDLNPIVPNIWGFFEKSNESSFVYDGVGTAPGYFTFYIPESYDESNFLFIDVFNGNISEIIVDNDDLAFKDLVISVNDHSYPISQLYGNLKTGYHNIEYIYDLGEYTEISFRIGNKKIIIVDKPELKDSDGDGLKDVEELKNGLNPYNPDTDQDNLPDNLDTSPLASLTLDKDKLHQIVIPHDSDKNTMIDMVIEKPSMDYSTYDTPRLWNGDYNVSISMAMRLFGNEFITRDDLVSFWKYQDDSYYSARKNYDGAMYGDAVLSGALKIGSQSVFLDGNGDYIACGDYNLPNTLFTACAWIKTRSSSRQVIIGEGIPDIVQSFSSHYVGIYDDNEIFYRTEREVKVWGGVVFEVGDDYRFEVDGAINDGKWHFIACVVNGSDLTLYFDNQNHTFTIMNTDTTADSCWIGSYGGPLSDWYFNGYIDDVRIYERAVWPINIMRLYNNGAGMEKSLGNKEDAWWKLDGNTTDSAMGLYDCVLYGGAIFSGAQKRGTQSLFLDGDGDYLDCGDYNLPNTLFTACAWFKTRSSSRQAIIAEGLKGESLESNAHILGVYDADEIFYRTELRSETNFGTFHLDFDYRFNVGAINDGDWHFIACIVDGDNLILYFDNQKLTHTIVNTNTTANNCWIGTYGGPESGYWFDGFIDDVRIYNYALKENDMKWLYNFGEGRSESLEKNETVWLKFDGNVRNLAYKNGTPIDISNYVETYSLVDNYNYTSVGDAIPDSRGPNAEVTFILAKPSEENFEFDITFPIDHPAKEDNVIDLRFDLIWLVTYYDTSSGNSSLLHYYDMEENITIQSMVIREISNVNYKLASPDSMIENQILWALTQNPELEDSINYEVSDDIVGQGTVDYFKLINQTIQDRQNNPIQCDIDGKPIENEVLYVAGMISNYDILNRINIIENNPNPSFEVNHSGIYDSYFSFYSVSNVYSLGQYAYTDEALRGDYKICYSVSWNTYIENNEIKYEKKANMKGFPIHIDVLTFNHSKVLKIAQVIGKEIPLDGIPTSINSQLHDNMIFWNQTFIERYESEVTIPTVNLNTEIDLLKEVFDNRQWEIEPSALIFDTNFDPKAVDFLSFFISCFKSFKFSSKHWEMIVNSKPEISGKPFKTIGAIVAFFQVMYKLLEICSEIAHGEISFRLLGSIASLGLNVLSLSIGIRIIKNYKHIADKCYKTIAPKFSKAVLIIGILLEVCVFVFDILHAIATLTGEELEQKLLEIAVFDFALMIVLPVLIGVAVSSAWATVGASLIIAALLFLLSWIPQNRPSLKIIDDGTFFTFPEDNIKRHGSLEVGDKINFAIQFYNNGDYALKVRTLFRLADDEGTEYEWLEEGQEWETYLVDNQGVLNLVIQSYDVGAGWALKFEQTIISPTSNLKAEINLTIDQINFWGQIPIRDQIYGPEVDIVDLNAPVLENNIVSFYSNSIELPEILNIKKLENRLKIAIAQYKWNDARKILFAIHKINPNYDPGFDIPIDVNIETNLRENITVLDPSLGVVSKNFSLDLGGLDDPQKEVSYCKTTLHNITVSDNTNLLPYDTRGDFVPGSAPFYIEQSDWWEDNSHYLAQQWELKETAISGSLTSFSELRVDVYLDDVVLGNTINDETSYFQIKGQLNVGKRGMYILDFCVHAYFEIFNYNNQQWENAREIIDPNILAIFGLDIQDFSITFTKIWNQSINFADYLDLIQNKWSFRVITSISFTPQSILNINHLDYAYAKMKITEASAVIDESNFYLEIPNTLVDYNFAAPDGFTITPNYFSQSLNSNVAIDISVDNPDQQLGGIYYIDFNVTLHNSGDLIYTERVPFRVPFIQDLTSPVILIEYKDGDETDGNPGRWNVFAYDTESGINEDAIRIVIDEQLVGNAFGDYCVPKTLGEHVIYVEVENNNLICYLLGFESESIVIVDDDITYPEINCIYTGDGTDGNPGDIIVTVSDDSGLFLDPSGTYHVPNILGLHNYTFKAIDKDNDRLNDSLSTIINISVTIKDDDTSPPYIQIIYQEGDAIDGNPGYFEWDIKDFDDGIGGDGDIGFSEIQISITYESTEGLDDYLLILPGTINGTWNLPPNLGIYTLDILIRDNDDDRTLIIDSLTAELKKEREIIDDDTSPPQLSNLTILDNPLKVNINLKGVDDSSGDDQGLGEIYVYIDNDLVLLYNASLIETNFEFNLTNNWIMQFGTHHVNIMAYDADDDRLGDSLLSSIEGTFEISFDEMKEFVLGEISQLIEKILASPDDSWRKKNNKATMINKLNELKDLISENDFEEAYDKLLHDIKPKLTGLKTDENEDPWDGGVFKNAWVACPVLQEVFRVICNEILTDITTLIQNLSTMETLEINSLNTFNTFVLCVKEMRGVWGYNVFLLIGLISIISMFLYFRRKKNN